MSANLTESEREALGHAVSCFAQKLLGYTISMQDIYIGRDSNGELFYDVTVRRPNGVVVVFRLTLTTPYGS
jgi:hypothetical protein